MFIVTEYAALSIYRFLIREIHGLCGIGALANIEDPAKMPHFILVFTEYQSTYSGVTSIERDTWVKK